MGAGYSWECRSCGAREDLWPGMGFFSLMHAEDLEAVAGGGYGESARRALAAFEGAEVRRLSAYFLCGECEKPAQGLELRFSGGPCDNTVRISLPPDRCPLCGEEGRFDDEPLDERELEAYVGGVAASGCPACGSKDVSRSFLCWD